MLDLSPKNYSFWDDVNFTAMVNLTGQVPYDNFTVNRNPDGTVSILINYSQDIHNANITVHLDPAKSGTQALSRQPPSLRSFPVVPTDN